MPSIARNAPGCPWTAERVGEVDQRPRQRLVDGQGEIDEYLASALSRLLKPQPARARTARLAYGFHSPRALIALMKLKFGGVRIPLPFSYARKHS